MDLSRYERLLNAKSKGVGMSNSTIDIVNATFDSNPAYEKVSYNNEEVDAIYKLHKYLSHTVYLTFRPNFQINKGDYVEFKSKQYIVNDFVQNEIYPKAEILFCNNTLRWRDSFGTDFEFPIFITGNSLVLDDAKYSNNNRYVLRSDSNLHLKIQYNEITSKIVPTQRFVINNKIYDATTISDTEVYEGKGFLEISLTSTAKSTTDNVDNSGIADNSGNSGWGEW